MNSDDGAAGLIAMFMSCLALLALALVGGVAQFGAARAQVSTAADLAALAAAGASSCDVAAAVAEANGAHLLDCWTDNGDVQLRAQVSLSILGRTIAIVSIARAGPP